MGKCEEALVGSQATLAFKLSVGSASSQALARLACPLAGMSGTFAQQLIPLPKLSPFTLRWIVEWSRRGKKRLLDPLQSSPVIVTGMMAVSPLDVQSQVWLEAQSHARAEVVDAAEAHALRQTASVADTC